MDYQNLEVDGEDCKYPFICNNCGTPGYEYYIKSSWPSGWGGAHKIEDEKLAIKFKEIAERYTKRRAASHMSPIKNGRMRIGPGEIK